MGRECAKDKRSSSVGALSILRGASILISGGSGPRRRPKTSHNFLAKESGEDSGAGFAGVLSATREVCSDF